MTTAIMRGLAKRCPSCGQTQIFRAYLKVVPSCTACGAPLGQYPSDDAPPYITMLVLLHIIIPVILILETTTNLPLWAYGVIFLPLATILTLWLLPIVKGGMIGVLLKLGLDKPPNE
jgi:uncharacterized protein (DUF983 family)